MTSSRSGGCHCGAVRFEAVLENGFGGAKRCNCSYCRMRGAVIVGIPGSGFRIVRGEDALERYRFHTRAAEHFFCSRCGIATHLRRRSDPTAFGINLACLDGSSPYDLDAVPLMDGGAHPGDTGLPPRAVATVRVVPVE